MKWFRNDVSDKEALELYRQKLRQERIKSDKLNEQLANTHNAAINILRLYGVEAVDRFKTELAHRGVIG